MAKVTPQYQVFFKRDNNSFSAKFGVLYEALDAVIRARGIGYKVKVTRIPK
jgi:hypothetical protein